MAKLISNNFRAKSKKKRKGIHSKNRSKTKGGLQYKKPYNKQGR
tara:strand:- start:573 stop:704 length:132 start_codon:yes stop_codon:yes gene_type:complete